jgi:hypothetical protein
MATSGTVGQTSIDVTNIIEHAYRPDGTFGVPLAGGMWEIAPGVTLSLIHISEPTRPCH